MKTLKENKSRVRIKEETSSELARPNILVGVPEVGLVGTISTSYLIQQLKLPEVGYLDSELIPQVVVVHDSKPTHPIRIYGKEDLAILIAETPITPRLAYGLGSELVAWAQEKEAGMIIGMTGIPSRNREVSDEPKSNVFAITNQLKISDQLKRAGAQIFEEGVMVGSYATLLSQCMTSGVTNVTLLAESHQQFPDPGAAASVLEVLAKLLNMQVDIKPLLDESEEIRMKSRELMSTTQAMQQGGQKAPGVYT